MFFGEVRIVMQQCYINKNVHDESLAKNPDSLSYALLTKAQYVLPLLRTIVGTILVTGSRQDCFYI